MRVFRSHTEAVVAALVIGVVATGLAAPAHAQSARTANTLVLDDRTARPAATIADLAWLAGDWEGEAFGGTFTETWGAPTAGTMVGMYRLMHDGETTLYELELIAEEADSLVLKVKHFDPDFSAWEEKSEFLSFPLVKVTDDAVYFEGFTLRRVDDHTVRGFLVTTARDGSVSEVELTYRRVGSH